MPLYDHFHGDSFVNWESVHTGWITRLADQMNDLLPPSFVAVESARWGLGCELDIGVLNDEAPNTGAPWSETGAATATAAPLTYVPAPPRRTCVPEFPDAFEVRIFGHRRPDRILAAIELISPSNKDRPASRSAFVSKCAGLIAEGTSVLVIDVVDTPRFNLHHELLSLLGQSNPEDPNERAAMYAASHSAMRRGDQGELDIWSEPMAFGQTMPTIPLRIVGDLFVPVDLESSYMETRRRRRMS